MFGFINKNKLSEKILSLEIRMKSLELELELYVKKLKLTKGLKKIKETEEDEDNLKGGLVPI